MMMRTILRSIAPAFASALALSAVFSGPASAADTAFPKPLAEESLPSVAKLPAEWPASFVTFHDVNFNALIDGRVAVVDTANPVQPLKGLVRASQFANFLIAKDRSELYTSETFYTRLNRGERTDVITIWDMATLQPKGEIVLPGGKRQQSVTYPHTFQLTNGGAWALVANFTPAQSVTVVDLAGRKVLGEVDLPGCSQIYPTGERGFTSLCADGSLFSVALDAKGGVASSKSVPKVQDIDNQALFGTPAIVGKTAWFVSFHGMIQGFDLSSTVAKPLPGMFSIGTAEGGAPEWRPGGWQVINADATGNLYVLMSPYGREGSHKDGGTEVWVVDPIKKARTLRIPLRGQTVAIAVTKEATPHLVAAQASGAIDIYDAASGSFVRTLGATVAANPILIQVP